MLTSVLAIGILFAHISVIVEPKTNGDTDSKLDGDRSVNGQASPKFLEEIRQHFELMNTKNERRIRSTEVESIKHGDRIALQSFSRQVWLDCHTNQCTQTRCPKLYIEGNDWNTCSTNVFQIYRASGPGEVLVGDLVGVYLSSESGKWLSCRDLICTKGNCPGVATVDHGFAIEEHWYRCYGEVFKIYARGRNISEPIMPNDDVLLNYIQEYNWVQSGSPVRKAGCPGLVRPPSAEIYDHCFGEVYKIWRNTTLTN